MISNMDSAVSSNDEILNMLSSARRQTTASIALPDGVYHRAMSRRKSLAEDEFNNAFDLPPLSLDSDINSSSSEDESTTNTSSSHTSPIISLVKKLSPKISKDLTSSPKTSFSSSSSLHVPEIERLSLETSDDEPVTPSMHQVEILSTKIETSEKAVKTAPNQSVRKIVFLKSKSSSANNLDVPSHHSKPGRRLSLNNLIKNVSEDQQSKGSKFSRFRSRRSSLPVVLAKSSGRFKPNEALPEDDETNDNLQMKKLTKKSKKLTKVRKKPVKNLSASSASSEEISSREDTEKSGPDEERDDMALGLNRTSTNKDGLSGRTDHTFKDDNKRRKTMKNVFKNSLFKSRRASKKEDTLPSSSEIRNSMRGNYRRPSQLNMGVPIEDVFSGIEFKTVDQSIIKNRSSDENEVDDNVVEEDPDYVISKVRASPVCSASPRNNRKTLVNEMTELSLNEQEKEEK